MNEVSRKLLIAFGIAFGLGVSGVRWSGARADTAQASAPHGGTMHKTEHCQFEIVFAANGLKVYPAAADGKPLDASKLSGTATFYHPNSPSPWFDRPLHPAGASPGQPSASLDLGMGLSNVPASGAKVSFEITGLSDPAETSASFTVPFTLTQAPAPITRPGAMPITYAKASRADQAAITAQRVCKVSGESLGSMGAPIKVTRGDRSVFLCCQGCLKKIQANPDQYFGSASAK